MSPPFSVFRKKKNWTWEILLGLMSNKVSREWYDGMAWPHFINHCFIFKILRKKSRNLFSFDLVVLVYIAWAASWYDSFFCYITVIVGTMRNEYTKLVFIFVKKNLSVTISQFAKILNVIYTHSWKIRCSFFSVLSLFTPLSKNMPSDRIGFEILRKMFCLFTALQ